MFLFPKSNADYTFGEFAKLSLTELGANPTKFVLGC